MSLKESSSIQESYDNLFRKATAKKQAFIEDQAPKIHIGLASCGTASGALDTLRTFQEEIRTRNLDARIHTVGCIGHCYAEPFVIIDHPTSGFPPIFYPEVSPGKAKMLTKLFIEEGDPRFEHMLGAAEPNEMIPSVMEFSRFNMEKRIVMEKCGRIDPENLDDYIAERGYSALASILLEPPEKVIGDIKKSGLRGRGGAGFPTGLKWEFAAASPATEKVVICNADEGDPGAYMDRMLLESNPHQTLEGMIICGYAIGAARGIIYVRAEYPLAVRILEHAIDEARKNGILGRGILGSTFGFDVEIFQGSGAFVCGEETALIRSIEGHRGMPRVRPPFPVEKGLNGKATIINNVKTLASVPPICQNGPDWFRKTGTESSPGTAIFSVVGSVIHPGLVEVPMGVTLRELIFDICGGIPGKKKFKAVQIGGPSGGCLSEAFLDTPIDYDSLREAGAMMGSGGMVVMDEDSCMVDVSRFFLDFTQKESCGKCTFCRIGSKRLLDMITRMTKGEGKEEDLEELEELGKVIREGSLCGLGKTTPNPVLTSLAYFRDEFEAHIREKKCPGMTCRALTAYYIDPGRCARGCDICGGCCPVDAVFSTRNRKKAIDQEKCVKCGECLVACPPDYSAVVKVSPPDLVPPLE